jgi:hypothetical protein
MRRTDRGFKSDIHSLLGAWFVGVALLTLIVLAFMLWSSWAWHSGMAESVVWTLYCVSFGWLNVSILRWARFLLKMGSRLPVQIRLGLGPPPDDPDELEIWKRGKHVRYSFLAAGLCMAAFAFVLWLKGE